MSAAPVGGGETPHWQQPDARMDAYYYGFERTGVAEVDWILSAVAIGGKWLHHTDGWADDDYAYDGQSVEQMIQAAADAAAASIRERAS